MSIKLITILKEALDVSWNPYEEKFKVGDKAKEIYGDEELCKILDKRQNWNEVETNPVKKSYIPMYIPADPEVEKESWYLIQYLEHNANRKPVWVPESNLESIESINEAIDVSWNPFEESRLTKEKVVDELIKQFNGANLNTRWKMLGEYSYEQNVFESLKEVIDELAEEVMSVLDMEADSGDEKHLELSDILNIENVSSNPRKPSKYIATIFDFEGDVVDGWTIMPAKKDDEKWKDFYVEALDVSWNPFEEGNSEFKIGDTVYEIGSEDPSKVIDLAPDFLSATKTTHFKKPVNWGKEYDYDFWYLVHYPLMDLFQWYPEEFLTKEPSAPELDETLDISWNPYQEVNYANKFYEFVDYDYSEGGPTALVFFRDEEGADLRTIVDLETGKILDASEWSGEGNNDIDLDLKVVEQLNQNEYIKDILRRWVYHINKNRLEQDNLDEDLDVSWNPYENSDYTVMMGQLGDDDNAIVKHYNTKNEHDALVEFFTDVLGQNTDYAKVAASETKKIQLKNSIAYKPKSDKFFWIVMKGYHKEDYINSLSREYRQKYNT